MSSRKTVCLRPTTTIIAKMSKRNCRLQNERPTKKHFKEFIFFFKTYLEYIFYKKNVLKKIGLRYYMEQNSLTKISKKLCLNKKFL